MAGRLTFKGGKHPSRGAGGWVRTVRLSPKTAAALESALGRPLSENELSRLEESCTVLAGLVASARLPEASRQDVARSLRAIARLDDEAAQAAYANVDASSAALIRYALHRDAPSVSEAARMALQLHEAEESPGGRPMKGWQRFAVKAALHHWSALGGADERPMLHRGGRGRDYEPSPLLAWVQAILGAVDAYSGAIVPTNILALIEAEMNAAPPR